MRIEILNKPFEDTVEIKRSQPLGFPVIKPEHLKFKYGTTTKKKKTVQTQKGSAKTLKQKTIEATWGLP